MKIEVRLILPAELLMAVRSLEPDDTPNISLCTDCSGVKVTFRFDRIGSAIETLDDYLRNLKVAREIEEELREGS